MASMQKSLRPLAKATSLFAPKSPATRSIPRATLLPKRAFATTSRRRYAEPYMPDNIDADSLSPTPITHFSETERMLAESVQKWANDMVAPKVREMDEN